MAQHLVIQLARFGDTIQTKRLLLSLAAVPGDTVHLVVDASLAAFAGRLYPFAVVHSVRAHATTTGAAEVLAHNRATFATLAAVPFARVYSLNFSDMAFALASLFDPDIVRGYTRPNGQPTRSRWFRMAFRWMENRRIAPMNLVDMWAHLHPSPVPPSSVNPRACSGGSGTIAVVAAGRESRRSLPPEVLAPLVETVFAANQGPKVVILGGATEAVFAQKLMRLLRPEVAQRTKNTCGKTSLVDLFDVLAGCACVLSPDTGIMHLAAHLGVPVQAFFLSSAWCFETGPYGDGHTVFQAVRSCAPCVESQPCPNSVSCLPPFADGRLQRALTGKIARTWPDDLLHLHSRCDAFGCDYLPVAGTLPQMEGRASLRALLAQYCGVETGEGDPARYAATVFHEADWMLPPPDRANLFL